MKKVDSNESCPCGSGTNYKDCHQQIEERRASRKAKLLVRVLVAIVILIIIISTYLNIQTSPQKAPGDAPEGKVWSPEHGHWHDKK